MKNLSATKLMTLAACASTSVVSANGRTYTSSSSKLDFVKASHSSVTEISRGGASDKNHNEKSHNKPSSSSSASKKKTNKTKKKKKRQRQTDDEKGEDDTPPPPPNAVVEEVLERSDFYEILGIGRSATQVEIKKAYRKRALHVHPDKTGGDRRAFDKVAESYDVLGDDNKRQLYNQFGKDGLENSSGGASAGSYQDVFRSMFQQQTRGYGRSRQNFTMRYQIEVTLEDLYKGITQQVVVTPPHHTPSSHRKQKRVSVDVPKGAYPGQHITLSGEMDFSQNDTPGDLVFVVQQAPHPAFTRKGHDLAMQLTITLEEAICGLKRDIRHLDGTKIWIESALVEDNKDQNTPILIQTGDVQVLKGRGMPKRHNHHEFGDLYIQFRVEMPSSPSKKAVSSSSALTNDELAELSRLLKKLYGKRKKSLSPEEETPVFALRAASATDFGSASGRFQLDEDEHSHDQESSHPFASQFFPQGGRGSNAFYFGSNFGGHSFGGQNPFGGGYGDDDDGDVQCSQM